MINVAQCYSSPCFIYNKNEINIQFQYIKEAVEIRVKSLKVELDDLHEKFKKKISLLESDVSKYGICH